MMTQTKVWYLYRSHGHGRLSMFEKSYLYVSEIVSLDRKFFYIHTQTR